MAFMLSLCVDGGVCSMAVVVHRSSTAVPLYGSCNSYNAASCSLSQMSLCINLPLSYVGARKPRLFQ